MTDNKQKRKALLATVGVIAVMVIIFIGLIGMAFDEKDTVEIGKHKIYRSDFMRMVKNREAMNCTVSYIPDDAYEITGIVGIPNPVKQKYVFAADADWTKLYFYKFELDSRYMTLYADESNGYAWSAMMQMENNGELYASEVDYVKLPYYKMPRGDFDQLYTDELEKHLEYLITKRATAGATIACSDGGASSYNIPENEEIVTSKIDDFYSGDQLEKAKKGEKIPVEWTEFKFVKYENYLKDKRRK